MKHATPMSIENEAPMTPKGISGIIFMPPGTSLIEICVLPITLTVFSVTADVVTGAIATQTVSRGYYNQPNGDTLQDYGPFTLTITKAGKMPYTQTGIVLSEKTKLLIALRDQLTGTATAANVAAEATFYKDDADSKLTGTHENPSVLIDTGNSRPVLNLNKKKLDNQLVLGL
jgi:hypothetical protein